MAKTNILMRVLYVISAILQVVGTLTCLADVIRQDFWNDPGDRPEDIVAFTSKWATVLISLLGLAFSFVGSIDQNCRRKQWWTYCCMTAQWLACVAITVRGVNIAYRNDDKLNKDFRAFMRNPHTILLFVEYLSLVFSLIMYTVTFIYDKLSAETIDIRQKNHSRQKSYLLKHEAYFYFDKSRLCFKEEIFRDSNTDDERLLLA